MRVTVFDMQTLRRRRRARQQPRNRNGEFHSQRSLDELLRMVAAVAEATIAAFPNRYSDARTVHQRHWNVVRTQLEPKLGRIPQANEICRQVRERTGDIRLSWPRILELALGDPQHQRDTNRARRAQDPTTVPLTVAVFALLTVGRERRKPRLTPLEYDQTRRELIAQRRRTRAGAEPIKQALPTSNQIITTCGSWDAALSLAGLPQQDDPAHGKRGVSVEDAFVLYYAATGNLPASRKELAAFAKARNFSLATMRGHTWPEWTQRGIQRISEFPELPPPPEA